MTSLRVPPAGDPHVAVPLHVTPTVDPPPGTARDEPSAFARLLSGLGREIGRGEALVHGAEVHGAGNLDPAQLIALEVGVYRYGEAVDLASRLIEQTTTAVRTVVQSQ